MTFVASKEIGCPVVVCTWEIEDGRTETAMHDCTDFDPKIVAGLFQQKHQLLAECSDLFQVKFVRASWSIPANQWFVGSFVTPSPLQAVVVIIQYQHDGAVYKTVTTSRRQHAVLIRSTFRARHGSLIRVNGCLIHDVVQLDHGDVIEIHCNQAVPRHKLDPTSKRVQICLDACIGGPEIPFDLEGQAVEVLDHGNLGGALSNESGWNFDYIPEGVHLHRVTYEALHVQQQLDSSQADRLELYVDGATCDSGSAWAVIAVYASDKGRCLCGCLAGTTETNCKSPRWIGATRHSNVEAETSAMAIATAFAFFAAQDLPVVVRPDLALSKHFLELSCSTHQDSRVAKLLYVLGQMLPANVRVEEVRAHRGDPWNELADVVAKWAAATSGSCGIVPWDTLHSVVVKPKVLNWEWIRHVPCSYQGTMPVIHDESVWQPAASDCFLGVEVARDSVHPLFVNWCMSIASYNALALNDTQDEVGVPGARSIRLDHQFHARGLAIVGVQEARTQEGVRVTDHYRIFSSGYQVCGRAHHFGCELWVHKSIGLAWEDNGSSIKSGDFKITVQLADPRFMMVSFEGPFSFRVLVAHAPCVNAERTLDVVAGWWDALSVEIQKCPKNQCLFVLADANAPLADHSSRYFGMVDAETPSPVGHVFQDFLIENQLYAPSTLDVHTGASVTWRHPRGLSFRRDYVLANENAFHMVQKSEVMTSFDGGFGHSDHCPVTLELRGFIEAGHARAKFRWDYAKMFSPDAQRAFAQAVETLPMPTWQMTVDDHASLVETNLLQLAQQHFGSPSRKRDRPVLQESTCNGIQLKRQALDMLRKTGSADPLLSAEIKLLEADLRPKILADQKAWYANWLDDIDVNFHAHDSAQVYRKLQRLGRRKKDLGKGSRPLPRLRTENGALAQSFEECQQTWRSQFATIEAGLPVNRMQISQLHRCSCAVEPSVEACAGPSEILQLLRKFKNGKVPGPGSLPVDVLKCGGLAVAKVLAPLMIKSAWHMREPLAWKGGLLVPLFKGKGSPCDPQAYRSIFLSDICAKVHHAKLRKSLAEVWTYDNPLIQLGGRKGCSTDIAHHMLHAHLSWAKDTNTSCALLFVDLQAAFYSVIRSSLFDGEFHDDQICFAMKQLGILPDEWHHIKDTVLQDYAAKGLGKHQEGILRDAFSGTHFLTHGVPGKTVTLRGTRPGDPIADVLFNMAFKLIVLDARQRITTATDLVCFGDPAPSLDVSSASSIPPRGFAEVTFVDDIAYALHSTSADSLLLSLQVVSSCLHDAAHARGLTLNYQSGKTEAVIKLAGPGSCKAKHKVWHELGGKLPIVTEHSCQKLQLVHSYKHLGSYLQDHGVVQKDVRYRNAQARKAFGQLHRPFYGKRNVQVSTKAAVFSSLVMSRHSYNAHTWAVASESELDQWANGLRSQVAVLAKNEIRPVPAFQFATEELCAIVGVSAPCDVLHANRLRYAQRAIRGAPHMMWSFLHQNSNRGSWLRLLTGSVAWLALHVPGGLKLNPECLDDCLQFLALDLRLKGRVKAALSSCLRFRQEQAKGKLWTLRLQTHISRFSDVLPGTSLSVQRKWQCNLCPQSFDSKKALAVHARHKHEYRKVIKYYVLSDECFACGKKYFSRSRALAHVQASQRCKYTYFACFVPAPEETVSALDADDR
eukprot:s686_g18.t1